MYRLSTEVIDMENTTTVKSFRRVCSSFIFGQVSFRFRIYKRVDRNGLELVCFGSIWWVTISVFDRFQQRSLLVSGLQTPATFLPLFLSPFLSLRIASSSLGVFVFTLLWVLVPPLSWTRSLQPFLLVQIVLCVQSLWSLFPFFS